MSTGERRDELATIRLLGRHQRSRDRAWCSWRWCRRSSTALAAGAVIVGVALAGVPQGLTGEPLAVPVALIAGLVGGALALGLLASVGHRARSRCARHPAAAMRVRD